MVCSCLRLVVMNWFSLASIALYFFAHSSFSLVNLYLNPKFFTCSTYLIFIMLSVCSIKIISHSPPSSTPSAISRTAMSTEIFTPLSSSKSHKSHSFLIYPSASVITTSLFYIIFTVHIKCFFHFIRISGEEKSQPGSFRKKTSKSRIDRISLCIKMFLNKFRSAILMTITKIFISKIISSIVIKWSSLYPLKFTFSGLLFI